VVRDCKQAIDERTICLAENLRPNNKNCKAAGEASRPLRVLSVLHLNEIAACQGEATKPTTNKSKTQYRESTTPLAWKLPWAGTGLESQKLMDQTVESHFTFNIVLGKFLGWPFAKL